MSSIEMHDLARNHALDQPAMSAVRGGSASGPGVTVNVMLNQQIGQFQHIGVNVLNNNSVIGADLAGSAAAQWKQNHAAFAPL